MFDTHMHTVFSTDSNMKIEEAIDASKKLNLGIIITEHMDINFPRSGEFIFDVDKYFNEYSKYRTSNFLLGVELGMRDDCILENKKIAVSYDFDYIIGSVHVIDNIDIYDEEFYEGRSKKTVYENYLNTAYNQIKNYDFVDSLGHVDYIARYGRYDDKELYFNEFSDILSEIFKIIIEKNIVLELNTKRLKNQTSVKEMIKIYKRYFELGGRNVCLGSDAHYSSNIGSNFKRGQEIADLCKLKTIYFKSRKPEYNK